MRRIVVFTGPSLHPDEAKQLTGAMVLPPIKRGDLASIESLNPEVIAIVDGEFYQSLAVSPKEILPFLERGVTVYGAASMGALRAVELGKFGMKGIGRGYRLFRRGIVECDDEVALAYCPWTYVASSEPLVNTRFNLRWASKQGLLSHTETSDIVARLREVYFPERTRKCMLDIAAQVLGATRAARLGECLAAQPLDVKNQDARRLMRVLAV